MKETNKKTMISLAYIKERQYSIIEAVKNSNVEPFKQFCRKYLVEDLGTLPDASDWTFQMAARKICLDLPTIPKKIKDQAAAWLEEIKIEEDLANGTGKITKLPGQKNEEE